MEILNQNKLQDIKLRNDQLLMKGYKNNITLNQGIRQIKIKADRGKVYLENKTTKRLFKIPIEDKIYIENINIKTI